MHELRDIQFLFYKLINDDVFDFSVLPIFQVSPISCFLFILKILGCRDPRYKHEYLDS